MTACDDHGRFASGEEWQSCRISGRVLVALALQIGMANIICMANIARADGDVVPKGEFLRRVRENRFTAETERRLTDGGKQALGQISQRCDSLGRMVTMREAMQSLAQAPASISKDDYFGLVSLVKRAQRSDISKETLLAALQDWDTLIRSLDMTYEVEFIGGVRDALRQRHRFVVDGPKLCWDQTDLAAAPGTKLRRIVNAYDGRFWFNAITVGQENIDQWERGRNVVAVQRALDTRWRFLDDLNPLVLQKILDVQTRFSVPTESSESVAQFVNRAAIFETVELINGRRCICLACMDACWYLCPELGFSLVSKRDDEFAFDKLARRVTETGFFEEQDAEEFVLVGESVWIPSRVTRTIFRGEDTEVQQLVVTAIELNGPVDPGVFSSVVPSGALFADPAHPVARHVASPGDIEKALDRSIQPRSVLWPTLIVGNVVAVIAIVLIALRSARRKPQQK